MAIKPLLMALLITTFVLYRPASAEEEEEEPIVDPKIDLKRAVAKSPAVAGIDRELIGQYSREYIKYIKGCASRLKPGCGWEIYGEILQNKRTSNACCVSLVRRGKECYVAALSFVFSSHELEHYVAKGLVKGFAVWDRCFNEVGTPVPFRG